MTETLVHVEYERMHQQFLKMERKKFVLLNQTNIRITYNINTFKHDIIMTIKNIFNLKPWHGALLAMKPIQAIELIQAINPIQVHSSSLAPQNLINKSNFD